MRVLAVILIAAIATVPALAMFQRQYNGVCAPRAHMVKQLLSKHGETAVGGGAMTGGSAVEIWLNTKTSSYTISHSSHGLMCLVFSGENWIKYERRQHLSGLEM
jgi:hypothetical protein